MSFSITKTEPVLSALQRIAAEQIENTSHEINDPQRDREEAVHQARASGKKLRSLLRLVRPTMNQIARQENARIREAAAQLSELRDAAVLLETYDTLMEQFRAQLNQQAFGPIRRELTRQRDTAYADENYVNKRLSEYIAALGHVREGSIQWRLDAQEFDAVEPGLTMIYRQARKAMHRAYQAPAAENFHEWRKRVKDHWRHIELLEHVRKPVLSERSAQLDKLSDLLGADHDLAVLRVRAAQLSIELRPNTLTVFSALIDTRSRALRETAEALGRRLFAEKPSALADRLRESWNSWRA